MHINYEFKAKCADTSALENILLTHNPLFAGLDHQVDTYFNVQSGRLKLREGNIENALIHYSRPDTAGAKQSDVSLYQHSADPQLKDCLGRALGIKTVVDKKRKIYFIDNVKFHFDEVAELGSFVEVEAIDKNGGFTIEQLKAQCDAYAKMFGLRDEDYIASSYSDLLLAKKSSTP